MSDAKEPIEHNDSTEPSPSETTDTGSKTAVQLFEEIHGFTSPLSQQMESFGGILAGLHEYNVSALSALIKLHILAFRMDVTRDSEVIDPNDPTRTFLDAIAGELEPYVEIIQPKRNDSLDFFMKVIQREPTERPELHDKVHSVIQCGYRTNSRLGKNISDKAWVRGYTCKSVVPIAENPVDAFFEQEMCESENPADDETRQTTSWWSDYYYIPLVAIAIMLIVVLLLPQISDTTNYTPLHVDMQTISDHVYARRYDEARKLLDKHEEWGDLELWSKKTRKYCDDQEANHRASDGTKALAPNKSTEAAEDNPDDVPAPRNDGGESNPIDNQTDNGGENSDTSQRAAAIIER